MSETNVAGVAVDTRHWIGGRRVASPAAFTDLSPIDERPVAEVARGGEAEVTQAVRAAGEAFPGWAATAPAGRAAALHAIADGIERRIEDLSQVETRDNGSLLRSHRRSVMPRVAQNFRLEVFGPVLTVQTFTGEDEAVALANDTPYGLAATMFTGETGRAERVSARLRAGTVWVNCLFVRDLRAPFGGAGLSGIGREGGTWSFDFYADVKNTVYAQQGWRPGG